MSVQASGLDDDLPEKGDVPGKAAISISALTGEHEVAGRSRIEWLVFKCGCEIGFGCECGAPNKLAVLTELLCWGLAAVRVWSGWNTLPGDAKHEARLDELNAEIELWYANELLANWLTGVSVLIECDDCERDDDGGYETDVETDVTEEEEDSDEDDDENKDDDPLGRCDDNAFGRIEVATDDGPYWFELVSKALGVNE